MSDEIQDPGTSAADEPPEGCCGSCCGAELNVEIDADDRAILSLGAGAAAAVFALLGFSTWLHWLTLPCGIGAVVAGYKALKQGTRYPQAATSGVTSGAVAVALFLAIRALAAVVALFT
ncbi:MAG: hypothetical protein IT204_05985 [Fimbriimonadaceae bacterium]|nr:hypothetical protein [Fimbriimonadaceae bacterium]